MIAISLNHIWTSLSSLHRPMPWSTSFLKQFMFLFFLPAVTLHSYGFPSRFQDCFFIYFCLLPFWWPFSILDLHIFLQSLVLSSLLTLHSFPALKALNTTCISTTPKSVPPVHNYFPELQTNNIPWSFPEICCSFRIPIINKMPLPSIQMLKPET